MGVGGRTEGRRDATGTATVLFTDLVGSTELRSRLGETAAEQSRRTHDALLADAVQRHGGSVVKGLGDGVMAVFPGAADAVAAGVAIQQAIEAHNRSSPVPLGVRVGISAGDVSWEEDDCFGVPVVEAARLCAAADGGQVLAADLVRVLTRGRGDHAYIPVGELDLKGLPEPVVVAEVAWTPLPSSARAGLELPPALAEVGPFPFAGRAADLDALVALWDEAAPGHRRVALVGGEPGIGKTRLAAEAGRTLHARGVPVLYGRCDDQLSVPFQPFVEALRFFVAHRDGAKLAKELGPGAGELVRLVPELAEHLPGMLPPLRADPETEAYALFEAVTAWLAAASAASGLVVVVDDLHWATKPTLLLLRHVARSPLTGPLLVVGTYRDTELTPDHPLTEVLRDLRRCSDVVRRRLGALDDAGVVAFVEASSGQPLTEDGRALADAVAARTGGNPFLVGEVLRHLLDTAVLQRHDGGWSVEGRAAARIVAEELPEALGRDLSLADGGRPAGDGAQPLPAGTEVPFPPALSGAVHSAFVGRVSVLEALQDQLAAVRQGKSRLVLVTGEPGIGKSRVTAEFAARAHASGATVLFGRCDEEPLRPYQPVAEAVETYLYSLEAPDLVARLGRGATELARLVPELEQRLSESPAPLWSEPETERFRLFETVAELATELAKRHPLVVVIDDLHWADKGTLLLLRHVLRRTDTRGVLVVATCREVELASSDALADLLGDLGRDRLVERIPVRGLDDAEVKAFLDTSASPKADAESTSLAKVLRSETEGNPFFLEEMVRYLDETGAIFQRQGRWVSSLRLDQLGVPDQVRGVITSRIGRLSEEANRTLTIAAVIGREFHFDVLQALVDLDEDALLEALEEAMAAGVLREVPGAVDTYAYSHVLVRDTLYESLNATRRRRLHRRIGELLESIHAQNLEPHLGELARHFGQAAGQGDEARKALDYARAAGARALRLLAYEEAARLFVIALEVLDRATPSDDGCRCDLHLALGDALWRAGQVPAARRSFDEAADIATELGDPERLAHAALGFEGGTFRRMEPGRVDEHLVALLCAALDAMPVDDSALRVRLLGCLSQELYYEPGTLERRQELSDEAVAMARRLGDRIALIFALGTRHSALWRPANLEERRAVSTEILGLAKAVGRQELIFEARDLHMLNLMEEGQIAAGLAEQAELTSLAEELHQPYFQLVTTHYGASRALLCGRFDEAEQLMTESLQLAGELHVAGTAQSFAVQFATLGRERGVLDQLEHEFIGFIEQYEGVRAWRTALAFLYAETDRWAEARRHFDEVAANDFAELPQDFTWMISMGILSETCAYLGDVDRASLVHRLLLPYERHVITVGAANTFWGSVDYYLGLLAATLSRHSEAEVRLERALEVHLRAGAMPFVSRTRYHLARVRRSRLAPGDEEGAARLLEQVVSDADRLGMVLLRAQAQALLTSGRADSGR